MKTTIFIKKMNSNLYNNTNTSSFHENEIQAHDLLQGFYESTSLQFFPSKESLYHSLSLGDNIVTD